MSNDISLRNMKDPIDRLEKKYSSIRKAGEALGEPHQNLSNWRNPKKNRKVREFVAAFEKIRIDLGWSEKRLWKALAKASKKLE